jgi:hypothetical protein
MPSRLLLLLLFAFASALCLSALRDLSSPRDVTLPAEDFRNQNQLVNESHIVLDETLALPATPDDAEGLKISELQLRLNTV